MNTGNFTTPQPDLIACSKMSGGIVCQPNVPPMPNGAGVADLDNYERVMAERQIAARANNGSKTVG